MMSTKLPKPQGRLYQSFLSKGALSDKKNPEGHCLAGTTEMLHKSYRTRQQILLPRISINPAPNGTNVSLYGKGNCYEKTAVDTFFKTIRAELIWRLSWQIRRAPEIAIFEYINGFSSPRRRHSALGFRLAKQSGF